jgi:putative flippase GtrA
MIRSRFPAMTKAGRMVRTKDLIMTTTATTTAAPPLSVGPTLSRVTTDVEIVVPVYNEQHALAASVHRLHGYLTEHFPLTWLITVADNASTDNTWGTACYLAKELDGVRAVHLPAKGRGRALRATWLQSNAFVVAYMDVDLSTDLAALLPLVAPLISGHSDVAIGSRLAEGARVVRGPRRELISRLYNLVLRATLHNSFSDAQCGFKAVRADVARRLVPLVEDNGWFFDTELLVLAERNGLRVHEVAVDWVDDPGSTVDVVQTAKDDLKGVGRMMLGFARGQGVMSSGGPAGPSPSSRLKPSRCGQFFHFAGVGAVSTLIFALLFALLYGPLGAAGADVLALALCALSNLVANRRFTFTDRGRARRRAYYARGLALSLLPLVTTLAALAATTAAGVADMGVDLAAITAANLSSTAVRSHYLARSAGAGAGTGNR